MTVPAETLLSLAAIVVGGALPLIVLVLVVRWRMQRTLREAARPRVRIRIETPREREPAGSLAWLGATIARARPLAEPDEAPPELRTCPDCGYIESETAVFCRRCGTRLPLYERRR